MIHKLIIIGSGPAGLTAGIYAARAELQPLIIEGKKPGGQLMGTSYIENWPGVSRILGPDLMMHMQEHAKELGCSFVSSNIARVDFSTKPFKLWTQREQEYQAQAIIIATGATPNLLGCPGEQQYWGKGVTTCAVCDGALYKDKRVIILGGGDTALEDASFMTKFTNKITMVHIKDELTGSKVMQKRVLDNPNINIIYQSTIININGDGNHVTEVTLQNQQTKEETTLETDAVFIAIGLRPQTEIFKGQIALDQWGYIKLTDQTKTSVPGVFAAGDVADFRYRQAITSAGVGCMAALDAERYLAALE